MNVSDRFLGVGYLTQKRSSSAAAVEQTKGLDRLLL